LLVRRHLKRPASRNQALAVEAIMEELAGHLKRVVEQSHRAPSAPLPSGAPPLPAQWGVLGLLSQLDLEYAEQNARMRGKAARQQAELEGLPAEEAVHLERWCGSEPLDRVELALALATILAELATEAAPSAHDLGLMRERGDERGQRLDQALEQLGLEARQAAEMATTALHRIAQDLR